MNGNCSNVERPALPCDDGFIHVELSKQPVPYHIVKCCANEISPEESQTLAMSSCWLACMCADVIRGRLSSTMLQRKLTANCLKKLDTLSHLMKNHLQTHRELRERLCYLPAVPHKVLGMFVSPTTLETTAHLTIGKNHYWANLVLKRMGSRWMCTVADLG